MLIAGLSHLFQSFLCVLMCMFQSISKTIPSLEGLVWSVDAADAGVRCFPPISLFPPFQLLSSHLIPPSPSSQLHRTFPICQNSNFQQISNFPGKKKRNIHEQSGPERFLLAILARLVICGLAEEQYWRQLQVKHARPYIFTDQSIVITP